MRSPSNDESANAGIVARIAARTVGTLSATDAGAVAAVGAVADGVCQPAPVVAFAVAFAVFVGDVAEAGGAEAVRVEAGGGT